MANVCTYATYAPMQCTRWYKVCRRDLQTGRVFPGLSAFGQQKQRLSVKLAKEARWPLGGGSRWDAGRATVGKWMGGQGAWPGGTRAWQMFGTGLSQSGRYTESEGQVGRPNRRARPDGPDCVWQAVPAEPHADQDFHLAWSAACGLKSYLLIAGWFTRRLDRKNSSSTMTFS